MMDYEEMCDMQRELTTDSEFYLIMDKDRNLTIVQNPIDTDIIIGEYSALVDAELALARHLQ